MKVSVSPIHPAIIPLETPRPHFFSFRALICSLVCLIALCFASTRSEAKPAFLNTFNTTYKLKSGGTIASASCNLCHQDAPPALNPYGKSAKSALKQAGAKVLTSEMLHSIESQDSDGDGFSNIEEINKDTLPGDPNSHPAGKPATAVKNGGADSASSDQGAPSPWDIKAAILEKNAQHPVLIHFPIGLFMVSLVFDLFGKFKKNTGLSTAGYYNLAWAALTSLAAVITGIIAWQWEFAGTALIGNLRLHLIFGISTSVLLLILFAIRKKQQQQIGDPVSTVYLALAFLTVGLITLTGHIGGILSGVVK